MRTAFAVSVVLAAFAVYACSPDSGDSPTEAMDSGSLQDGSEAPFDGSYGSAVVDAGEDAPAVTDASYDGDGGCTRNPVADSNCSSMSRQAYLCPGDAGQPSCDFFAGYGEQSLYCCE